MHRPSRHKIVMIGDPMVGKTSMMNKLTKGYFMAEYHSTIGSGCGNWTTDDETTNLQIWDTAGQEKYRSLGCIFYQNASAAIVTCALNDLESVKNVQFWIKQFMLVVGFNTVIAIAANKSDIIDDSHCKPEPIRALETWAKEQNYIYKETSAKTGDGIHELFEKVAERISKINYDIGNLIAFPIKPKAQQKKNDDCC